MICREPTTARTGKPSGDWANASDILRVIMCTSYSRVFFRVKLPETQYNHLPTLSTFYLQMLIPGSLAPIVLPFAHADSL